MGKRLVRIAVTLAVAAPLIGLGGGAAHAASYKLVLQGVTGATCHYAGDAGVSSGAFVKYFCNRPYPASRPNYYDLYAIYA